MQPNPSPMVEWKRVAQRKKKLQNPTAQLINEAKEQKKGASEETKSYFTWVFQRQI